MSSGNFSNFQNNFRFFCKVWILVHVDAAGYVTGRSVADLGLGLFVFDELNSHGLFSNCYVVVNGYDYALFAGLLELLLFFWASRFSCQSRNSSTSCLLHIFRCSFVTLCCTVQLVSLLILTIQSFVVSFILILYHMFRECQGVFLFFLLLFGWLCLCCFILPDKVRQGDGVHYIGVLSDHDRSLPQPSALLTLSLYYIYRQNQGGVNSFFWKFLGFVVNCCVVKTYVAAGPPRQP